MKIWFLTKMIKLCNYCLTFSDGAEDQNDINELVQMKNYFTSELDKLTSINQ